MVILNALRKHTATVIFVHGLGDSGLGWKPVASMLSQNPSLQHIKWVLPDAPSIPVTLNYGMTMPAWFDIVDLGFAGTEDEKGMLKTVHSLNQLITAEVDAGIPADRIVLGGFSQGAAMTLLTGLTTERKLAGLTVLSGWLPLKDKFKAMVNDHFKKLPIFWGHGTRDQVVRYVYAEQSVEFLKSIGVKDAVSEPSAKPVGLSFHSYAGLEHSTSPKELDDLQRWIEQVIPDVSE
ncbi:Phospholipase/carboxylesterase [Cristinia sonorae]|uniref:Acyl-protein thioesterase 1 n=1 Tax=Cristinia sonorae TaxID=1940300 RepID=A0A8K0XMI9_9AGAR|nr:Phospholipase/carboxylesterase [Cristinia sonorae]